ncbi:hypothetical protein [Nostoc sp.]
MFANYYWQQNNKYLFEVNTVQLSISSFSSFSSLRRQSLQRGATAVDGNACIKEPARWAALPTCSDWRQVAWEPPFG